MDPLIPRKPQDVDRWSDQAEQEPTSDPTTGPQDRWVNEAARGEPDYPAPAAGDGGVDGLNQRLEGDGTPGDEAPADPTIHGQAR